MAKDEDSFDEEFLPNLRLHHLHTAHAGAQHGRPEPVPEVVAGAALLESPGPARLLGQAGGHATIDERPDLAEVVGCLPVCLDTRGRQLVVLNEDCTVELLSIRACLAEVRSGWDRDTGCPLVAVQAPQQFGAKTGAESGIWLIAVAESMSGVSRVLTALSAIGCIRSDFGSVYDLDPNVAGSGGTSEIYKGYERSFHELDGCAAQSSPLAWWSNCWADEDPLDLELSKAQALAPSIVAARLVRRGGRNGAGTAGGRQCGTFNSLSEGVREGLRCSPFSARDALPLDLEEELFILSAVQDHPNVERLHGLFYLAGEESRRRAQRNGFLDADDDDEDEELPIVSSCYGAGGRSDSAANAIPRMREDAPVWALVTDYYLRGNLYRCLGRVPSEARTQEVMRGLLSALHHIHDRGVIHRDVKIEHIFVSDLGRPVLADFESACWADDRREVCRRVGTPGYIAPEMYLDRVYNEKVDVFAAGVVMFYALSRVLPFLGGNSASTQRRTCHLDIEFARYSAFDMVSRPCKELLQWLLSKPPSQRPHAEETLDHCWFVGQGGVHSGSMSQGMLALMPLTGVCQQRSPTTASRSGAAEGRPVTGEAAQAEIAVGQRASAPPAVMSPEEIDARPTWEASRGSGTWGSGGGEDDSSNAPETRGTSPGGTPGLWTA
eukprot:CAMPEP_0176016952 /NCGR_PEP_ID=MMETSP0120_2-20121206/8114_1 /TAXON_ID=160619 /ORGANISM="Kryptoperidinium foliaceum, Strain CCMP 1326" /LENGTH=664 /DNA_ID=CAMNT_0017349961 /DNA_START=1 /DNA_END=1991 /DNA_ORIENTATION=+